MKTCIIAAVLSFAFATAVHAEDSIKTPWATVSTQRFVSPDSSEALYLTLNGGVTEPRILGNSHLDVELFHEGKDWSLILVTSYGGSACPVESRHWLVLSAGGYNLSPKFGTCTDEYQFEITAKGAVFTQPGFEGAFTSKALQKKAAKTRYVFMYDGETLTETTYVAKTTWISKNSK